MPSESLDRWFRAAVLLVFVAGGGAALQPLLLPTAEQAVDRQLAFGLVDRKAGLLPIAVRELGSSARPFRIAVAAEAAALASENDLALSLYARLPRDGGRWEFLREMGTARRLEVLGRAGGAEKCLIRALELSPQHLEANDRLGHLLQIEGRTWESAPHFFRQIVNGKCRGDELLGMANTEQFFRFDERLQSLNEKARYAEVILRLGDARRALYDNNTAEAEKLLRLVLSVRPELGEAQGRLGRIIVDRGDMGEFLQWRGSLPDAARDHPEVWFAQGMKARRLGQLPGATRCLLECLNRSPNHLAANVQIAGCLETLGRTQAAREFAARGTQLAELETLFNAIRATADRGQMTAAIAILGTVGRYWEAAGWAYVMTYLDDPTESKHREFRKWLDLARRDPAANSAALLPARLIDAGEFPFPQWGMPGPAAVPKVSSAAPETAWGFVDDARRLGIDFEYFEGTSEKTRMQHIFNTMGGGLGAIDYDLDGWPDLYFAQANDWRNPAPQAGRLDRLFRNLQGERFLDVTLLAGLRETGFSHGVTVGDFDQDGFPDIYVGNKGRNTLFHNNGDGTFNDATVTAGVGGNEWSTSSVFADFSGDGLPDLYVLNYTRIDETARKECHGSDGERVACTPDVLIAEDDRLYINEGNGTFRDVSARAGILAPNGRGLGVIAWDFGDEGRLGLFVANDTTANFLFLNQGLQPDGTPRFREEGVARGVAFNADGIAQASMGVAAGDATGDGRIELFVTNFFADSNTFYSQRADGFFEDLTRPFELRDPSFWMLGFGCQFADFNGDGWDDLIATNGHVDQRSSRGDPDRMPPQLFQNLEGRRFVEVSAARLGPFFQGRYLGRGLAVLDWNRDGRPDVAISHLHAPVALLTNTAPPATSPLVVRLIGRNGCREPTGATIRLEDGKRSEYQLVTGGDGFLATNERRHQFSMSPGTTAAVEVRWPGGKVERWEAISGNQEILIVEGSPNPFVLRRF